MTPAAIIQQVAAAHGTNVTAIRSKSWSEALTKARVLIAFRLRNELGMMIKQIAYELNRSKSAVEYYLYPHIRESRRQRSAAYMQARKAA